MKPIYALFLLMISSSFACQNPVSEKTTAKFTAYSEAIFTNSKYIADKKYRIYLPPSYSAIKEKRYPVLYMMDGNNLFHNSEAMGTASWNVHSVADSLSKAGLMQEIIIVGVDHAAEKRFAEYMPQKPMEDFLATNKADLPRFLNHKVFSDAFLNFLTKELKPQIDQDLRTKKTVSDTYIAGASMGGLISMYAVCEYPSIFAGALCLSTHWCVSLDDSTPEAGQALVDYFAENLPTQKKWYFDYGTLSLDQYYGTYQAQVDSILATSGYEGGINWLTKKYEGHTHNEMDWNRRLHIPLTFALKKEPTNEKN